MSAFDDAELAELAELAHQAESTGPLAPADPIETARSRHRTAGAILAAGMLGLEQALGLRKPREEAPVVIDASDDPLDIDRDGIVLAVDECTSVIAPPQLRSAPLASSRRRRRR